MLAADIKDSSQVNISNLRRDRKPFADKWIIPELIQLKFLVSRSLLLPLSSCELAALLYS